MRQERVHQTAVEIDAPLIDGASAIGHDPRPRDAESIMADAQRRHEPNVLLKTVIVIAGHVPGIAILRAKGRPAERIPRARAPPIFARRTLDLVCGGGHAPPEVIRE